MDISKIFNPKSTFDFDKLALQIFQYQSVNCSVYKEYLSYLEIDPLTVTSIQSIPFLPIQFFKNNKVLCGIKEPQISFSSSGTSDTGLSIHHVSDLNLYKLSYSNCFEYFYGPIEDYTILALLPNYSEREGSSLIFMVDDLIKKSKRHGSGFYLNNLHELSKKLNELNEKNTKVLLIGVSYALLNLVEQYQFKLKNTTIMETGGMKGRRKELIREELHQILANGFGVTKIHSEYGMTELLSQAYSKGNGVFECPAWMRIVIRDPEDALTNISTEKSGGINIIDLANINSCSFIATQDLGRLNLDGTFEVLGRFDNSDIRGCNLLVVG